MKTKAEKGLTLEDLSCCFFVGAASGVLKSPQQQQQQQQQPQQTAENNANANSNSTADSSTANAENTPVKYIVNPVSNTTYVRGKLLGEFCGGEETKTDRQTERQTDRQMDMEGKAGFQEKQNEIMAILNS